MTSSAPRASTYQLPVPDEAVAAIRTLLREPYGELTADVTAEHVRAISAPVVAAEYREVAQMVDLLTKGWRNTGCRDSAHATDEVAKMLRGLADEIDGGA